jgi:hypothetical protein
MIEAIAPIAIGHAAPPPYSFGELPAFGATPVNVVGHDELREATRARDWRPMFELMEFSRLPESRRNAAYYLPAWSRSRLRS